MKKKTNYKTSFEPGEHCVQAVMPIFGLNVPTLQLNGIDVATKQ
jgi:hypothetical protein